MASKEQERFWLDQALQVFPDLAAGHPEESEAPDFLFRHSSRRIGIEVTRFAHPRRGGRAAEAEFGAQTKLLRLARKAYEEAGGAPLSVVTLFSSGDSVRTHRIPAMASEIAAHVAAHVNGLPPWSRYRWTHDEEPPPPHEIDRLTALVLPSPKGARWYPVAAGWVWNPDAEAVLAELQRKEARTANYRRKCDEIILLLVFDGIPHRGSVIHAPAAPFTTPIETSFDRVVCFDVYERRAVELTVTSRAI